MIFRPKDICFSGKCQLFQYNIVLRPARRHIIYFMNNALRIIRYLLYISTLQASYRCFTPQKCCSVAVLQLDFRYLHTSKNDLYYIYYNIYNIEILFTFYRVCILNCNTATLQQNSKLRTKTKTTNFTLYTYH